MVFNHTANTTLGMALETLGVTTGRRDKLAIMADLLDIMQEPRRLTHILYKSNMSYVQLVKYLETLIEMGFAEKTTEPYRAFGITSNGKLFMDLVKKKDEDSHSK
jgi:predicted transcriptional regulator